MRIRDWSSDVCSSDLLRDWFDIRCHQIASAALRIVARCRQRCRVDVAIHRRAGVSHLFPGEREAARYMVVKLASGFLAHLPRDGIEARLGERLPAVVLCDQRLEAVPPHDIEAARPFLLQIANTTGRERG